MHLPSFLFALTWAFALVQNVRSKVVFAHYMVGSVTADHVKIDIDQAQAAGIQGFSLNIADPSKDFVASTLAYMFAYAPTVGFHLHISMDIWASGDSAGGHPEIYDDLLAQYMHVSGYFTMNGLPYVTTFSDGGLTNTLWNSWRSNLGSSIYFCPDFDGTTGYTSGADGWWYYWGDSLDCVLSWEAAWPVRSGQTAGSASQGSIEIDLAVLDSAVERGKQYNMPLSALQYKNAYGTNIYRQGDLTLVKRMANIIGMTTKPDFVTVITWNDGPESHYVGNVWPEQNTDSDPARYVTAGTRWDHGGWRSLIKSFTTAYLNGGSSMLPSSTTAVEGAMWYRGVMQSSVCPSGSYPDGWEAGTDQVNWAIVVGTSLSNIVVHVTSGSVTTIYTAVGSGLHYGVAAKHPGQQLLEVYSGTTKIAVAQGGRCVSSLCPDGIFNMNDIVVGVVSPGSAPSQVVCEDPTCADVSRRYVPVPQPQSRRNVSLLVRQSEDFNYYSLNHAKIATDLMVGDLDGDGNRKPRQNCIFYVNQRDVDSEDPNYAKNRAVQFADIMNAAYPGSDYVRTLASLQFIKRLTG
ncbi:glycosyl hydrolase family 71-domain-containing protein [Mycena latifolia]|nr:glycosyl hydrolase family 71-domain-containing protein [Mycena latifolia]